MSRHNPVVAIIGAGGMGVAVARRLGGGATIVLADIDADRVAEGADELGRLGHQVETHTVDVGDADAVGEFAELASHWRPLTTVVHTAGLSPVQAGIEQILRVDLVGVAHVLDAFGPVIHHGGAGVVIASMAGSMTRLDPGFELRLRGTPTADLLGLPELQPGVLTDPGVAYGIAKRANQVRVQAAAAGWGERSARVNCVSPGIIATAMGNAELAGPSGETMRTMIAGSATARVGTPDEIAAAVAFLVGPDATFVTGADLLVDGGVVASLATAAN